MTICFYIFIGIIGLFGLAFTVVSIASLVHNLRQNSRVKKYINEEQEKQQEQKYNKAPSKYNKQEHKQYVVKDGRPVVITQSGCDNQKVTIGYVPYNNSNLYVEQTVQANAGNKAERPKKHVRNNNQVLSKHSRNNTNENKHGKFVPKYKIKNYNEYSKYNRYNHKFISRAK